MTTWMTLTCLLATTSWLAVMCLLATGCEKPEPEFNASQLAGQCFKAKLLTTSSCTSFTNVQVLNANIGNTTVYMGREYRNVVQINNIGELDDPKPGDEVFFVVDSPADECRENFRLIGSATLCTANLAPVPLPGVTVAVCVRQVSETSCR